MKELAVYATVAVLGLLMTCAHAEENERKPDERQSAEDRFSSMDADGDNQVSRREFISHAIADTRRERRMSGTGISDDESERLRIAMGQRFDSLDSNSDDVWTLEEFNAPREQTNVQSNMSREKLFESLDADDNGEVSAEEFNAGFMRRLQGRLNQADEDGESTQQVAQERLKRGLQERFKAADKNDDGVLSSDEFR